MNHHRPCYAWEKALKYPKPDYLSSSRKRLIPQIIAKGSILKQWNKKQAVAMQTSFYETLPKMKEVERNAADFAFFLYDLDFDELSKEYHLRKKRVIYTEFSSVLKQIAKFEAGPIENFTKILQKKLDKKRNGEIEAIDSESLVVE